MNGYRMDRTLLTSRDMQMILAGLRSLDSVSGSRYYGQLMEKVQAGSSEFVNGRDSILIDLSSWYRDTLPPKIGLIQEAIELRRRIRAQSLLAERHRKKRLPERTLRRMQWERVKNRARAMELREAHPLDDGQPKEEMDGSN